MYIFTWNLDKIDNAFFKIIITHAISTKLIYWEEVYIG